MHQSLQIGSIFQPQANSMKAGCKGKPFSNPNVNGNTKEIEIVTY